MHVVLDGEMKSKAETLKQKKKLELDLANLEKRLDVENRISMENQKITKKLNTQLNVRIISF
jgi:hypothetical protein